MAVVTEEMKRFLKFTTIKGAPRTVNAKSTYERWAWTISVSVLLACVVLHTMFLVFDYFQYNTYISIQEHSIRDYTMNDWFNFTVCNKYPIMNTFDAERNRIVSPFMEYRRRVRRYLVNDTSFR